MDIVQQNELTQEISALISDLTALVFVLQLVSDPYR